MKNKSRMKRRKKWKAIRNSFLGIIIVAAAVFAYEYYQLQPKNHFNAMPVVGSKNETQNMANTPWVNILVMGSDQRQGDTGGHTDSMILVHVDLKKDQANAVSIPRDTRVHLNGYGYTKLTSVQYILQTKYGSKPGAEQAANFISQYTGVPINYYLETNFDGLQAMVDALGGIQMNVPATVKIGSLENHAPEVIPAGPHFFDGGTVLALVRERHSLANGDYGRQQMQLEAIKGIAKTTLNPQNLPKLPSLVNSLSSYIIATNMSTTDMASLGLAMKNLDPNKQLHYQQIPGTQEILYDDILEANNDEIVVNPQQMKNIIAANFNIESSSQP